MAAPTICPIPSEWVDEGIQATRDRLIDLGFDPDAPEWVKALARIRARLDQAQLVICCDPRGKEA